MVGGTLLISNDQTTISLAELNNRFNCKISIVFYNGVIDADNDIYQVGIVSNKY